jgi:hypothetical protein
MDYSNLFTVPNIPYLAVSILPCMFISVVIFSIISPHDMAEGAGFPQPKGPVNPFFWLFVGKEAVIGITLIILEAAGEWRAVAIICAALTINGFHDFAQCGRGPAGWVKSFGAHGIMTLLFCGVSWQLLLNHWRPELISLGLAKMEG